MSVTEETFATLQEELRRLRQHNAALEDMLHNSLCQSANTTPTATSQQTLMTLWLHMPAAVCVLQGADHRVKLANPGFYALMGQRALPGKTAREAFSDVRSERFFIILDQVYRTGLPLEVQAVPLFCTSGNGGEQQMCWFDMMFCPTGTNAADQRPERGVIIYAVEATGRVQDRREMEARKVQIELLNQELATRHEVAEQERMAAEQAAARIARLQHVTSALGEVGSFGEVAEVIVEQGAAALGAWRGAVWAVTDKGATLEAVRTHGYAAGQLDAGTRMAADVALPISTVARTGQSVWVRARRDCLPDYPLLLADEQSHAWVTLPLIVDGQVSGCIGFSFAEEQHFSHEDRSFALALAQQCAHALQRARLYEAEHAARAAAEAAVWARDQIFHVISHDLKVPLTAIQGYARLLKRIIAPDVPDGERVMRGLNSIDTSAQRLMAQIEELLDVASVQGGQPLTLRRNQVDMVALVRRTVESCIQISPQHCIIVDIVPATLYCIGDELRFERVVNNLLTNASKYSAADSEIRVMLAQEEQHGEQWAVLTVSDQGIGIPAESLEHIFEPFHRAHNVMERIPGTGLGLPSARQIVEQHGGRISVTSQEGQGSTFRVHLPLALPGHSALLAAAT